MNPVVRTDDYLTVDEALRLDKVCDRFEAAWQAGPRPLLEDFLRDQPDPARRVLLGDLLHVDLSYRRRAGEGPSLEEYRRRFPQEAELVAAIFAQEAAAPPIPAGSERPARQENAYPEPALPPPVDPLWIGKYRVVEHLGSGAQGDAFRAVHPELGRDVVLKWARSNLSDTQRQKLLDEGRVLARIDDPGLVRVHDVDVCQDRPFIVLEYVAGQSLTDRLTQGPFSFRDAAALVADIAAILGRLHQQGIWHRDLKPANILLDAAGRPRLIDFGLATFRQQGQAINPPEDSVCGTFHFMAPEQANGQGDRIGPRTDLFSLGAVLHLLLTGQPPYSGDKLSTVWEQARQGQVPPPRLLNPRIPQPLERICCKALTADPEQRYASAAEMERALRGYLLRPRLLVGGLAMASLVLVVALVLALRPGREPEAFVVPSTAPETKTVETPLSGELIVRVWTAEGKDKVGLRVDEAGALPVRNQERLRLQAQLTQPAHVYLLWLDSEGKVTLLYPWNEGGKIVHKDVSMPPPPRPPQTLVNSPGDVPGERKLGWKVGGKSGLDTILLLARRQPLRTEVALNKLIGPQSPTRLRDPHEWAIRGADAGQPIGFVKLGGDRGPEDEAAAIDDPLLQMMGRLQDQFEIVRAVRFAHQEK